VDASIRESGQSVKHNNRLVTMNMFDNKVTYPISPVKYTICHQHNICMNCFIWNHLETKFISNRSLCECSRYGGIEDESTATYFGVNLQQSTINQVSHYVTIYNIQIN